MIKNIVKELTILNKKDKIQYISFFLAKHNIPYIIHNYHNSIVNIEVKFTNNTNFPNIILSAHFDISHKTKEGANDNSSSVAVLLELCRSFSFNSKNYNLIVLFNDNEELLGALHTNDKSKISLSKIINNVGSFLYLKNTKSLLNISYFISLELCGIGDSLFIAKKSGEVVTDKEINTILMYTAEKNKIKYFHIDIPSTDLISAFTCGIKGTVIGIIPSYQVQKINLNQIETLPAVWRNIHSDKDNFFAIQEEALKLSLDFLKKFISAL